jgi:hypothetical protein
MIPLCNKLTCLNGVITLEATNRLKDKLGGIFTVAKTHYYMQGKIRSSCQRHSQAKVLACHRERNMDPHYT